MPLPLDSSERSAPSLATGTARFLVIYGTPTDVEAFERHYRDVHIPLATRLPGLRRYSVSRDVTTVRGGAPGYLVAQLEWDSAEALRAAFGSPEGRATAEDMVSLTALSNVQSFICDTGEVVWNG